MCHRDADCVFWTLPHLDWVDHALKYYDRIFVLFTALQLARKGEDWCRPRVGKPQSSSTESRDSDDNLALHRHVFLYLCLLWVPCISHDLRTWKGGEADGLHGVLV
jgi:hypothetical protein